MASINYAEAAHLLRRAGFGGSPEDINGLAARGREGAVDSLVNYERQIILRSMRCSLNRSATRISDCPVTSSGGDSLA